MDIFLQILDLMLAAVTVLWIMVLLTGFYLVRCIDDGHQTICNWMAEILRNYVIGFNAKSLITWIVGIVVFGILTLSGYYAFVFAGVASLLIMIVMACFAKPFDDDIEDFLI